MVATLLSLKLHLAVADLKRSTVRLVLWIVIAVNVLFAVGLSLVGLAAASLAVPGHEAQAGWITVVCGTILVAGWTLLPLIFFGFDQTLDPARFAPFPLTGAKLAPGLILAGLLGLPGLFTAVVCLGAALPWLGNPLVLAVGLVASVLGFLMTQVCARVASTALSGMLSSRKAKDMMGVIGLVVILVLSLAGSGISMIIGFLTSSSSRLANIWQIIEDVSAVASWTPFGAPWALIADAGSGQWLLLVAHLGLTCAYLGVGLWAYGIILNHALVAGTIARSSSVVTKDSIARLAGLTWVRGKLVPVAAIAARCLRYWRRDPRYLGQIPAMLFMPIVFCGMGWGFQFLPTSSPEEAVPAILVNGMIAFGLGFMALMAGYTISADIAYDSTAWWIHLATGVKGWQDRLGRVAALSMIAVPIIIIVGIAVPWLIGSPSKIVPSLAAMVILYLSALGVSSIASALVIYPIALPGESPLKMKTGMMGSQALSQMGSMTVAGLLALPICIWVIFATSWQAWLALGAAIVVGGAMVVAGVILGGKIMDSRGPTILQSLKKNDSSERS
ncbi:MAG: hypothetical protein FWD55_02140 [Propionibacteriaceae bacterium]|nr:hypothetical protein [Propionibacteriaceae bacterium]